jgi:uncharacterized membrane protein YkgB
VVLAIAMLLAGLSFVIYWLDQGGRAATLIAGSTLLIAGFLVLKDVIQSALKRPAR